jgi:hypothetical protein
MNFGHFKPFYGVSPLPIVSSGDRAFRLKGFFCPPLVDENITL